LHVVASDVFPHRPHAITQKFNLNLVQPRTFNRLHQSCLSFLFFCFEKSFVVAVLTACGSSGKPQGLPMELQFENSDQLSMYVHGKKGDYLRLR
jgi:hypothetical protein